MGFEGRGGNAGVDRVVEGEVGDTMEGRIVRDRRRGRVGRVGRDEAGDGEGEGQEETRGARVPTGVIRLERNKRGIEDVLLHAIEQKGGSFSSFEMRERNFGDEEIV